MSATQKVEKYDHLFIHATMQLSRDFNPAIERKDSYDLCLFTRILRKTNFI